MLELPEINEGIAFDHVNLSDPKEAEVNGPAGSGRGILPVKNLYDWPHQKVGDDELADSEDEVDGSGFSNSASASRRRLRMVLDVEDDD